jgi:hypothetical protein
MPPHHCPWPVGLADISAMFGVAPDTSTRWKYRSSQGRMHPPFPPPDGYTSGAPFWWDITIAAWAADCGRTLLRWPVRGSLVDIDWPTDLSALTGASTQVNGRRRGGFVPAFRVTGQ